MCTLVYCSTIVLLLVHCASGWYGVTITRGILDEIFLQDITTYKIVIGHNIDRYECRMFSRWGWRCQCRNKQKTAMSGHWGLMDCHTASQLNCHHSLASPSLTYLITNPYSRDHYDDISERIVPILPAGYYFIDKILIWNAYVWLEHPTWGLWYDDITDVSLPHFRLKSLEFEGGATYLMTSKLGKIWRGHVIKIVIKRLASRRSSNRSSIREDEVCLTLKFEGTRTYPFDVDDFISSMQQTKPPEIPFDEQIEAMLTKERKYFVELSKKLSTTETSSTTQQVTTSSAAPLGTSYDPKDKSYKENNEKKSVTDQSHTLAKEVMSTRVTKTVEISTSQSTHPSHTKLFYPTSIADVIYAGVGFFAGILFVIVVILAQSATRPNSTSNKKKKRHNIAYETQNISSVPDMYGSSLDTSLETFHSSRVSNHRLSNVNVVSPTVKMNTDLESSVFGFLGAGNEITGNLRSARDTSFYGTMEHTYAVVSRGCKDSFSDFQTYQLPEGEVIETEDVAVQSNRSSLVTALLEEAMSICDDATRLRISDV